LASLLIQTERGAALSGSQEGCPFTFSGAESGGCRTLDRATTSRTGGFALPVVRFTDATAAQKSRFAGEEIPLPVLNQSRMMVLSYPPSPPRSRLFLFSKRLLPFVSSA